MLLIDIGNSAVKCRWYRPQEVHDKTIFRRDYNFKRELEKFLGLLAVQPVYIASVADTETNALVSGIIRQQWQTAEIHYLTSQPELDGLINGYDDYHQLGVDRWLAILAAHALIPGDCLVMDAGSAITLDVLSREKGFLGGAILPGLKTDQLRFLNFFKGQDFPQPLPKILLNPGRNTRACLCIPEREKFIPALKELIQHWSSLLKCPVTLVLTGQDAAFIGGELHQETHLIPDLVFQGMLHQIELLR
ncbi:MAG: type III pantothenate kinase [Gammaproteobacteria bacterium]|nr:type III pantothenate kinase [Gammaproteobacteria bacterium]